MKPVSVFDIFKIGIGPSSSHTVGPMLAARHFASSLLDDELALLSAIRVDLYGSLSLTGKGHGTDRAVICGLEGYVPDSVDLQLFQAALNRLDNANSILVAGKQQLAIGAAGLISFHSDSLPLHPNGLIIEAQFADCSSKKATYYSVGGGFITDGEGVPLVFTKSFPDQLPYPFSSGAELLSLCKESGKSIAEIVLENERTIRSDQEIKEEAARIWAVMNSCIERGCSVEGVLPGGLKVSRRAKDMISKLNALPNQTALSQFDYLSCYALAVNEENASYGRVVTAPTNGAAGVIPAVFRFYVSQLGGSGESFLEYLLTASAIANLFKSGASLSAAEMGCQGEIGVAASMAAAAITALHGGSAEQVENAAEIAIEHSLGLTCDPVGGLVQIPCIERNAIGAAKAITSSQLAMKSDGKHIVSLDQAISAMKKTGNDMHSRYKETSTGGLAISVAAPEC